MSDATLRLRLVAVALVWRRRLGPDFGRESKHHFDSLSHSFVACADTGTLEDQAQTSPARPRQRSQGGLKIQPRDRRHTGALRNLVDFGGKGAQVTGHMTGGKF
ncbi:hypothetical protein [Microvirga sp. CF3016]|uniref:hypothetical protein n=1 Tax=Microvirga sp. CF3016 TaxID=3110181 RepID=UPI002E79A741|nr:hypothetical protein [Microvirga sp. CF3016]MEE1613725.1 hypothetical protein [Microvirga sp. CF3016]